VNSRADERLAYSQAVATSTVATDMISLALCMNIQVTGQAMYVNIPFRHDFATIVSLEKTNYCISRKCVILALDTQREMCMNHIAMCPARHYHIFPNHLTKHQNFREKSLNIKC
jgi:hypothetical protein